MSFRYLLDLSPLYSTRGRLALANTCGKSGRGRHLRGDALVLRTPVHETLDTTLDADESRELYSSLHLLRAPARRCGIAVLQPVKQPGPAGTHGPGDARCG